MGLGLRLSYSLCVIHNNINVYSNDYTKLDIS